MALMVYIYTSSFTLINSEGSRNALQFFIRM